MGSINLILFSIKRYQQKMKLLYGLSCLLAATSACTLDQKTKDGVKNYLLCELKGLNIFELTEDGFVVNLDKYFTLAADTTNNEYDAKFAFGEAFGVDNDIETYHWNVKFTENSFVSKSTLKQDWTLHPLYYQWFPEISKLNPKSYDETWVVAAEWDSLGDIEASWTVDANWAGKKVHFVRSIATSDVEITNKNVKGALIYKGVATSDLPEPARAECLINVGDYELVLSASVASSCLELQAGCRSHFTVKGDTMFASGIDAEIVVGTNNVNNKLTMIVKGDETHQLTLKVNARRGNLFDAKRYTLHHKLIWGDIESDNNLINIPSLATFKLKVLPIIKLKALQVETYFTNIYKQVYNEDPLVFAHNVIYGLVYIEEILYKIPKSSYTLDGVIRASAIESAQFYELFNDYAREDLKLALSEELEFDASEHLGKIKNFNSCLVHLCQIAEEIALGYIQAGIDLHIAAREELNEMTGPVGKSEFKKIYGF